MGDWVGSGRAVAGTEPVVGSAVAGSAVLGSASDGEIGAEAPSRPEVPGAP